MVYVSMDIVFYSVPMLVVIFIIGGTIYYEIDTSFITVISIF